MNLPIEAYQIRGLIFYNLMDYQKAIENYNKAIENISNNPMVYLNIGKSYYKLNDYTKSVNAYNKAIELDPKSAISYTNRGLSYYSLKDYQNTLKDFNKAIQLDPNYARAYCCRALIFHESNDSQNSINDNTKAIELDPKFSTAYHNRGITYSNTNEYQKAIDDYNKAVDLKYINAYYSRGFLNKKLDKYPEAINDFQKYIDFGDIKYRIEQSKNLIKEISEIQNNSVLKELENQIHKIQKLLLYEEDEITHFTGLTTSALLVGNKESLFRLSESSFLNDTSEGQRLNKYIGLENGINPKPEAIPFIKKPFIGCFVPGDKSNDLTLWRMYAKENQEEAKGCSFSINRNLFIDNIKNTIINGDKESKINSDDFKFYRVSYLNKDKKNIIPGAEKEEALLDTALENLKKTVSKISKKNDSELNMQLKERLNAIEYLFKDDAYFYESEIRLVMNGIGIEKKCSELNTSPKVYIEIAPIRSAIKRITIGPKVDRAEEWAALFHYQLNKDNKQETEIQLSQLPFK